MKDYIRKMLITGIYEDYDEDSYVYFRIFPGKRGAVVLLCYPEENLYENAFLYIPKGEEITEKEAEKIIKRKTTELGYKQCQPQYYGQNEYQYMEECLCYDFYKIMINAPAAATLIKTKIAPQHTEDEYIFHIYKQGAVVVLLANHKNIKEIYYVPRYCNILYDNDQEEEEREERKGEEREELLQKTIKENGYILTKESKYDFFNI